MECLVYTAAGVAHRLPPLTEWVFSYGLGEPCDSFALRTLWKGGRVDGLDGLCRFAAWEGEEQVFSGVVDEYCWSWSEEGETLELTGRGMAARLLDNESEPVEYSAATLRDILAAHVTPHGVTVAGSPQLPAAYGFTVSSGASQWSVVRQFARQNGGVAPRFDRGGRLVLEPFPQTGGRLLDEKVPVLGVEYRDDRYSVLSRVVVRDKTRRVTETVTDEAFEAVGGSARRVYTMPGESSAARMKAAGRYQLDRSGAERRTLTVTAPILFFAWPGELVSVNRKNWGCDGLWRVAELESGVDRRGEYSTVTLIPPDVVP